MPPVTPALWDRVVLSAFLTSIPLWHSEHKLLQDQQDSRPCVSLLLVTVYGVWRVRGSQQRQWPESTQPVREITRVEGLCPTVPQEPEWVVTLLCLGIQGQ